MVDDAAKDALRRYQIEKKIKTQDEAVEHILHKLSELQQQGAKHEWAK